jgi:predicted ATPase/transcriptional regulator with XRE-family HTH domain
MDPEVSFGAWVARRRKLLDFTRAEVARCAGCSVPALRKIESDERRPSRQLAERLAECLQIPSDQRPLFLQAARGERRVERLGSPLPQPSTGVRPGPPRPVSNLPLPPTPLLGREAELAALARLLHDPHCRLLTLIGPGGIGKTRLALAAAAEQQTCFPDGVYFVSLAPLTSSQFIAPAIADSLGLIFSGPVEPKTQLLHDLREKSLLLVLDNLEHLLEAAELLAELLQHAPGLKLLVTSRERLNLHSEWVFEIQGLPVPPAGVSEDVDAYSAVTLFVQSARRAKADFKLQAGDHPLVARICRLVEGMPLGIELAAAWVSVLTCWEIAHEIERSLDFLAISMRDLPKRQQSLRATFDHSWGLLSPDKRSVLCRLAVFQGGFERAAAEQVAGATLPLLLTLVSKSLVRRTQAGRYDLHEVVRQYALLHLAGDPQAEIATHDRHCDFYLALLRDREVALKSAGQREAIRELTDEIDNIRAAWIWAIQRENFTSLGPAIRSYGWLFEIAGWLSEGIQQLELVVQAIRSGPEDEERLKVLGEALTQQALLFFRWGRFDRALAALNESLSLLRRFNDPKLLDHPLVYSGIIIHLNGDLDQARSLMKEGLACAQAAGDPWFATYADFNLGYIASLLGRYEEGYQQMTGSLASWRAIGDPRSIALGLNFLSPTVIKLGRYQEAEANLQESLALCTQVGDRWGMGTAYRFLGLAALAQAKIAEAETLVNYSLDVFNEFVTGWDIVLSLVYLGEIKAAAGDFVEARRIFLKALPMALEVQALPLALEALVGLAYLAAQAGQAEQALERSICVLCHPAATQAVKERAEQLVVELEAQLSPPQIEAVGVQAKPFETIVKDILSREI